MRKDFSLDGWRDWKRRFVEMNSTRLLCHLSKYCSLMPTLALLFELADLASSVGFEGSSLTDSLNVVGLENARRAVA